MCVLLERFLLRLLSKSLDVRRFVFSLNRKRILSFSDSVYAYVDPVVLTNYNLSIIRPQIRQDYPLNLSILISGGKETNKDSPSNGE